MSSQSEAKVDFLDGMNEFAEIAAKASSAANWASLMVLGGPAFCGFLRSPSTSDGVGEGHDTRTRVIPVDSDLLLLCRDHITVENAVIGGERK